MNRDFRSPSNSGTESRPSGLRAGQSLGDLQCAIVVIEEVVVRSEEVAMAELGVDSVHLIRDPLRALCPVVPLVVGGDRAIWACKFAAERHHERTDW